MADDSRKDELIDEWGAIAPARGGRAFDPNEVEAVREQLADGARLREAKSILNNHLHKVNAVLMRLPDQWVLWTDPPDQRSGIRFNTFGEAFDAALKLLEERTGSHVTVTKSDEVLKRDFK